MSALIAVVPGPGLLFGLMLLAAILGGYSARLVRVPRVVGFLLGGVLLRVVLYGVLGSGDGGEVHEQLDAAAKPLEAIKALALGLILFTIGGVFERSHLRAVRAHVLKISLCEVALSVLLVFAGCFAATAMAQTQHGIHDNLVLALLLALAAIATAPAATLLVLQEYESKGSITDTILGLTGINNIVCIVLFYLTFLILASSGAISASGSLTQHLWLAMTLTVLGSVAMGIVCGTLISIVHTKLPLAETLLVFFGMFILLGTGEQWLLEHYGLSYNFLLTTILIGAIFANVATDSQKLVTSLRTVGSPILAGFFVLAGYGMHLANFVHMGWVGGAYVVARLLGKAIGCHIGVKWAGAPQRVGRFWGTSLMCQAAVVIGLASFIEQSWQSDLAEQFATVVLGSVVVFELTGPLLLKRCVVQGGEVKAITLLRRTEMLTEGESVTRLTLRSLFRLFGWHSKPQAADPGAMSAKHIMRTNVEFIPASATLDEVLHLIERSRHSHFPVVHEDGDFVGVVHFSDIRNVIYDPLARDLITAVDLADPDSPIVPLDMPLTDLLELFTSQNVGMLPVTERPGSKTIVGIVEQRDLLRALHLLRESR